jgi:hypothetical protein
MCLSSPLRTKADFIALAFLSVVSLALAMIAYSFGGVDFSVYYAAGRVMLRGGSPYDYHQLAGQIISSAGKINNPYYYAPWFTWAMLPLAFLPYNMARIFWAVINFILWFCGLFNLNRLVEWPLPGWRRWGMYLLVTFIFAWATWGSEQVGILIFLLITFMISSFEDEKWLAGGLWMALLLFKPNITFFPIMALTFWFIYRRKWRPVLSMVGALILLTVLSFLISPGWYLYLFQTDKLTGLSYTLSQSGTIQTHRYTTTLLGWLSVYGIVGKASGLIYGIAALAGTLMAVWVIYKAQSIFRLMAVILLLNFALVPYALFYDYPSLVLTLFVVNNDLSMEPRMGWMQYLMNGLILVCLFVGINISYRYWMVIVLGFFMMIQAGVFSKKRATT